MPLAGGPSRPAVFLDRDGTVIEDRHYLGHPDGVALLPAADLAIARLNRAGIPVVLVTNQSGIGRGLFAESDFQAVQARLVELLHAAGARLDAVYHCPHAPGVDPQCDCRKPGDGLFRRAAAEHGLDLARSAYVGDRVRDVAPGLELGGRAFLIAGSAEPAPPGAEVVASLAEAVARILERPRLD